MTLRTPTTASRSLGWTMRRLRCGVWVSWLLPVAACSGDVGTGPLGEKPAAACAHPGAEEPCYPGPVVTASIGECRTGTSTCTEAGVWGECVGYVLPTGEECDDSLDNDCSGLADDGCGCSAGASKPCYTGPPTTQAIGGCQGGEQRCVEGIWSGECDGEITPGAEACDKLDNDCNGVVDDGCACAEGETLECYGGTPGTAGVGACKSGIQICKGGVWPSTCKGEVTAKPESCNGVDDDCDGAVDEQIPGDGAPCDTGKPGICAGGVLQCGGSGMVCVQQKGPTAESCDGLDDDCNGKIDDVIGAGQPCATSKQGVCAAGTFACSAGKLDCLQEVQAGPESCNGLDDDCDGSCDAGAGCRIAVHRSWHPVQSRHLYTTNTQEASCCGYQVEVLDYYHLAKSALAGTTLFRRCLLDDGNHLYTTSENCDGTGGTYEGPMGYIATAPACGTTPLYSLKHPQSGNRFYTVSAAERDYAIQTYDYLDTGVSGHVWLAP